MRSGWKRNKDGIHPWQKSQWTCRQKTWVEACYSHTGFQHPNPLASLRDAIIGFQTTLCVNFAMEVLIRVAGNHGVRPPSVDPEEKFPSDFRPRITGAPPKCELYRRGQPSGAQSVWAGRKLTARSIVYF